MTPEARPDYANGDNSRLCRLYWTIYQDAPGISGYDTVNAITAILAHFDEHEPAVADAIRYGLEAQHDEQCPYGATNPATECCSWRNSWEIKLPARP